MVIVLPIQIIVVCVAFTELCRFTLSATWRCALACESKSLDASQLGAAAATRVTPATHMVVRILILRYSPLGMDDLAGYFYCVDGSCVKRCR